MSVVEFLPLSSDFPQATLERDGLSVHCYLPDAQRGFYRSSRFDWSGMIASVKHQGHTYFGQWREYDPEVPECGIGPCEEFGLEEPPPLWDSLDRTFVKLGVGVLQRTTDHYDFQHPYPLLQQGRWDVEQTGDSIRFKQCLAHKDISYTYEKQLELCPDGFDINRTLVNHGAPIHTTHYNHCFFRVDDQPVGPDYEVQLSFDSGAFPLTIEQPEYASVDRDTVHFHKPLLQGVPLWTPLELPKKHLPQFAITHKGVDAGVHVALDHHATKFNLFAVRAAVCPEPFVPIDLNTNDSASWCTRFRFGTKHEVSTSLHCTEATDS
eukprot:NODE_3079_length_1035_cov_15.067181_g2935_i0.p1 GENE.NODE_3079_length_1035_cov_15.067181_g2935_i0~~NODE_3079_length_1035_cov_15.067181_g2935_i0.p1  ORF type:complete len:322 (-),score=63.96 NODE_3079_length_1035_cov_15.067181_g2935_i0:64-1029(-)